MLPVSKDTLLRVVRRHAVSNTQPLRVVGIDDWAWKRGQRYGTIVCDLERRCIVDLLPDRETGTVEAWLAQHRSEEHTSELQSLMRSSYAVFCLKKKNPSGTIISTTPSQSATTTTRALDTLSTMMRYEVHNS